MKSEKCSRKRGPEYVSPAFAGKTWHDWSGLLFFFPASLVCLALLHSLLAGEWIWLHRGRVVMRRHGNHGEEDHGEKDGDLPEVTKQRPLDEPSERVRGEGKEEKQ